MATFGGKRYRFAAGQALMVAVDIPSRGTVVVANPKVPYLGVQFGLDYSVMREMAEEIRTTTRAKPSKPPARGAFVVDLNSQMVDCALRAVNMLQTPDAIPKLYPGIVREVCYWLLTGPYGPQVTEIMIMSNGQDQRVVQAIKLVRDRLEDAIRVADLARASNMSQPTFHRQFKAVTGMTPIQYQKQLRLHEGRRLMISDNVTVETAAHVVGYSSVSQFSREYTRMFGRAPRRDVSTWRRARPTE